MMMDWTIEEGGLDRDDVNELLAQHVAEMNAGSPPSACHVLAADALDDPAIRFFTARDGGGMLLGCGALKRLAADHGEIKSMRTADAALGAGIGGRMLDHLIVTARQAGMARQSLETGSSDMFAAANRLYERDGFERCGPFGDYDPSPFTRFFTKAI